jgi:putative transposase
LYRWSSYRFNGLGEADQYVLPHPVYLSLGKNSKSRQTAYRNLFRAELDTDALCDIRQALTQNQPLGNSHFYAKLETMTGVRREPKPRGRPKKQKDNMPEKNLKQGELPL